MHLILSIAFLWVLSFPYFVLGGDSPSPEDVNKINLLVSPDKQQLNTVKFLNDPKNWTDLFDNAVSIDLEGTIEVVKEVCRILSPGGPDSICEFSPGALLASYTSIENYNNETGILRANLLNLGDEKAKNDFKFKDFIYKILEILTFYDAAYKDKSFDTLFKSKKPIGDVAKPLSLAMKKFSSTKWEKEFYEKIKKAADNESSEGALDKKGNSGGTVPNPSGIDPRIVIAIVVIVILLIAGVITFLILKRK